MAEDWDRPHSVRGQISYYQPLRFPQLAEEDRFLRSDAGGGALHASTAPTSACSGWSLNHVTPARSDGLAVKGDDPSGLSNGFGNGLVNGHVNRFSSGTAARRADANGFTGQPADGHGVGNHTSIPFGNGHSNGYANGAAKDVLGDRPVNGFATPDVQNGGARPDLAAPSPALSFTAGRANGGYSVFEGCAAATPELQNGGARHVLHKEEEPTAPSFPRPDLAAPSPDLSFPAGRANGGYPSPEGCAAANTSTPVPTDTVPSAFLQDGAGGTAPAPAQAVNSNVEVRASGAVPEPWRDWASVTLPPRCARRWWRPASLRLR